ncbi:hypothetical protein CXT84_02430 [Akkermansia muciniphila]|nr:hypothetical protein CXT93_01110 [Akkermansia muciniphila]PNC99642.1 hypothetical protein CXT87_06470 [Akkermansia muciniphila]PND03576.1 hypothetical protein CXT86_11520 [Akkermansia muciniphila]PND09896.1 hypothetical protein CXT85_07905 [Akkermansia muciniphila]PND14879.1 hypothetical protein CXT84_02430 [Akkermansia muciniphila]
MQYWKKTATLLLKFRSRTEFTAIRLPPAVPQKGKTDSAPGQERSIVPAKTAYPHQNIYRTTKRAWSGSGFLHRASPLAVKCCRMRASVSPVNNKKSFRSF